MPIAQHAVTGHLCPQATVSVGAPSTTAQAIHEQLGAGPHAMVMCFAAPTVDRPAFAQALRAAFPQTSVVGCTTAGEVGEGGLTQDMVTALALPASEFRAVSTVFEDVRALGVVEVRLRVRGLIDQLRAQGVAPSRSTTFALLLVDGMSVAEELLANSIGNALGDIRMVGGSAGDGLEFCRTHVFHDGVAYEHGALLVLVHTELPFEVFKTQHFVPGDLRMVVTAVDCSRRNVREIDGEPAAAQLARSLGLDVQNLDPTTFATHPVVVRIGGSDYVRSIQKVEADGSLTFYCAIEEGIVLRDARGVGLVQNLENAMAEVHGRIGDPQLTIVFDCILRRLECQRIGALVEASALLERARAVGFSTYGEQFGSMHVNQTLTGVAIGRRP